MMTIPSTYEKHYSLLERPIPEVGYNWHYLVNFQGDHLYFYFVNGQRILDKG